MRQEQFHGMLVVNKPSGICSKDVSRSLVKKFGRMKLSHVGTLDPMASGILPILFGNATKLQDYLLGGVKEYEFTIKLGLLTDTLDITGQVLKRESVSELSESLILSALSQFKGNIRQVPPLYSAIKHKGKPLYYYARKGISVSPESFVRNVEVYDLKLLGYSTSEIYLKVTCSKGTYIRSLGLDIASKLGYSGVLSKLIRTKSSGYTLFNSVELKLIKAESAKNILQLNNFIPMDKINIGLAKTYFSNKEDILRLQMGQKIVDHREEILSRAGQNTLLIDLESNIVFGIGYIRQNERGNTIICMKRGFK